MVAANDQRHVGETTGFSMFDTHTHTLPMCYCSEVQSWFSGDAVRFKHMPFWIEQNNREPVRARDEPEISAVKSKSSESLGW